MIMTVLEQLQDAADANSRVRFEIIQLRKEVDMIKSITRTYEEFDIVRSIVRTYEEMDFIRNIMETCEEIDNIRRTHGEHAARQVKCHDNFYTSCTSVALCQNV